MTRNNNSSQVLIVGAGPVGMVMALLLAKHNIASIVIDKKQSIQQGSKALCYSQSSLQIFDNIGIYDEVKNKGEILTKASIYHKDKVVYSEDLAKHNSDMPRYLNLSQNELEIILQNKIKHNDLIDLRLGHQLKDIHLSHQKLQAEISNSHQRYALAPEFVIAADGANSLIRQQLNIPLTGKQIPNLFLVADVKLEQQLPCERKFLFCSKNNDSDAVLMIKQPGDLWRFDFKLPENTNPIHEKSHDRVRLKIQKALGPDTKFTIKWISTYYFKCQRATCFGRDNIFLVGDAAHQVAPFGARGANSGFQDAFNLAWKLKMHISHGRSEALLDSYQQERIAGADHNIELAYSSASFIAPSNLKQKYLRHFILSTAKYSRWSAARINSGQLYTPEPNSHSSLNQDPIGHSMVNQFCYNAKLEQSAQQTTLFKQLGDLFGLIYYYNDDPHNQLQHKLQSLTQRFPFIKPLVIGKPSLQQRNCLIDIQHDILRKNHLQPGHALLLRPDHYIVAGFTSLSISAIQQYVDAYLFTQTTTPKEKIA